MTTNRTTEEKGTGAYAQVNGVWIPTSIEAGRKGGPKTQRFTVESVEGNVQAGDELFRFPAGPGTRATHGALRPGSRSLHP